MTRVSGSHGVTKMGSVCRMPDVRCVSQSQWTVALLMSKETRHRIYRLINYIWLTSCLHKRQQREGTATLICGLNIYSFTLLQNKQHRYKGRGGYVGQCGSLKTEMKHYKNIES